MNEIVINNNKNELIRSLFDAINFAAYKHRYQKRKGLRPVPYINHPIAVTKFLLDYLDNPDLVMLQSAILHDTLEDTKTTFEELKENFGEQVAHTVGELTDDMSLSYNTRKKLQVEHAGKLSYEAGCIKIADKFCNVHDLLYTTIGWPRSRKILYINWSIEVVCHIQNINPVLKKAFFSLIDAAKHELKTDFNWEEH